MVAKARLLGITLLGLSDGLAKTHVAHHLFPKIPHYHAWEAPYPLKAKLGPHCQLIDENYWVSFWKGFSHCCFVEDEGDLLFYKNAKGQALVRMKESYGSPSDSEYEVDQAKSIQIIIYLSAFYLSAHVISFSLAKSMHF
ncbi:uncharacterized protein MELLADRAFT_111311 [Melampsora larici-populina 98AG31]|uniref:Fatty acid desaturase domain-containing protein n=1 Tax=Melampsora larici-populina (strain 98AG31 / pathotype 3-4-7) TaxID=747676 RepID=F4S2Q9_MELLP|nr:uncharacterized protein MELLADRAFT_111311 [Melampsora larici-populina 98AG31]EGG01083.1 hypothetical protein MELLADRAFT_111311 [Melampsora larici-populina 98AG31]